MCNSEELSSNYGFKYFYKGKYLKFKIYKKSENLKGKNSFRPIQLLGGCMISSSCPLRITHFANIHIF